MGRFKKTVAVIGAAALTIGGFFVLKTKGKDLLVPAYKAARIVDGDTFDTTERQIIRLASANAPELNYCAGEEAKKDLEKLLMNKKIYLKVVFRDTYDRFVSVVYTDEGMVNENLIRDGYAYFNGYDYGQMQKAMDEAKAKKKGIFSDKCIQKSNLEKPGCVIKGNRVEDNTSQKEYRFPGCGQYNNTLVQLSQGDQWFCTEAEAKAAGFTKGSDCFEKKWK